MNYLQCLKIIVLNNLSLNARLRVKRWYFVPERGRVKPPLQMPVFSTYPIIYDVFQFEDTDEAKFRFHKNHVKLYYPSEGESSTVSSAFSFTFWFSYEPGQNPHD